MSEWLFFNVKQATFQLYIIMQKQVHVTLLWNVDEVCFVLD